MKRQMFFFFLLVFFLVPQAMQAGDTSLEASGAVLSHYMWRGIHLSEGGVFQPSLTVSRKGFSANLWANYQFDPHRLTEVDITGKYSGEMKKIRYEAGYVHYGVYQGKDSDEIYGSVGHSNFLKPSFQAYFDVNAGKGAYLQTGLDPSVPLSPKASLNFKAHVGYVLKNSYMGLNDGGREFSNFYGADFQTSLSISLGKRLSFEPMLGYSTSLSRNARQAIKNSSVSPHGDSLYGGGTFTFSLP
jgi:hypothetical protein